MAKIDFKTTDAKKKGLKIAAQRANVSVSYIMNKLVDDYLDGKAKVVNNQEIAARLGRAVHAANHLPECESKKVVIKELEEIVCLM